MLTYIFVILSGYALKKLKILTNLILNIPKVSVRYPPEMNDGNPPFRVYASSFLNIDADH